MDIDSVNGNSYIFEERMQTVELVFKNQKNHKKKSGTAKNTSKKKTSPRHQNSQLVNKG